ncbi:outer membrane protein [alpha proteobacterium U9-1i]|nr:outer membrane protein [alpha proteobacterium U9-1i]
MRQFIVAVVAVFALTGVAAAQTPQEMDRAEAELRSDMAPAGVAVERVAPDEIRLVMPSDITFGFDQAYVRREFLPRLTSLARTLNQHRGMSVEIVGHADAVGSDGYNQDLSERRARAVGSMLREYGVDYSRLAARGMGEWQPIASNADEWGRAQNRRVEISLKAAKK